MLYVLLDIENDHYLTDPLGTISKSKFIWMKFILIIFFFSFSDSERCFYLEKSDHLSMFKYTKGYQFEPILISNVKQEVCFLFNKIIIHIFVY
jgi:hypothetical protein